MKYFFYFCLFFFVFAGFAENKNLKLKTLISEKAIEEKIVELSKVINKKYQGKELVIILAMKGGFIFAADLVREIKIPCSIEAIRCSSYGNKAVSSGNVKIFGLENMDIANKHVIFVDDIFDTGNTLTKVMNAISKKKPKSLESLVLVLKKKSKNIKNIILPDYYLFEVDDKFLVGYGMDYKEKFRCLKNIYSVE